MGLVQSQLMSWPIGLNSASNDSLLSNLSSDKKNNPALHGYLHQEAIRRNQLFCGGVLRYQHSPLPGPQPSAHTILNPHDALKFHYYASDHPEAAHKPVIFLIPSLVNKYYILDLRPEASLSRYLVSLGMDVIVVEWPVPSESDSQLSSADYVEMLLDHLQRHWDKINRSLITIGYCMGGVLALALTQLFSRVKALALLATPWDYTHYPLARNDPAQQKLLSQWVEASPLFSHEALQLLIYLANPYRLYLRFSRFAQEENEEMIASFVALEHWANDGVPISQAVARECLITWPQEKTLLKNQWKVCGETINPLQITAPCFMAIPQQDYIVPPEVSMPLATMLPNRVLHHPCTGHVGMIAGMKRYQLWEPLGKWLNQVHTK